MWVGSGQLRLRTQIRLFIETVPSAFPVTNRLKNEANGISKQAFDGEDLPLAPCIVEVW